MPLYGFTSRRVAETLKSMAMRESPRKHQAHGTVLPSHRLKTVRTYVCYFPSGLTAATDHDDGDPEDIEPGGGTAELLYWDQDADRLANIPDPDGNDSTRICINLFQEAVASGKFGIATEDVTKTLWLIAVLCP